MIKQSYHPNGDHPNADSTPDQASSSNVLARLAHLEQWVAWKYGPPRENGKHPKIPIDPRTGWKADTTDSRTWTGFEAASEAVDRYGCAGVGFVFTDEDGFAFVDLDGCVHDGEVEPSALAIVEEMDSYTEISPSGTGLKIFLEATKPGDRCRKGGVEMYDKDRFSTFTGVRFSGGGIEERQKALNDLYRRLWPATPERTPQAVRSDSRTAGGIPCDSDLLEKARNGGADPATFARLYDQGYDAGEDRSGADCALLKMMAFWTGRDADRMERLFSSSALGHRDKWRNREDYRRRTIEAAIARTTKTYDPKHGKPRETTREGLRRRMGYALWVHRWNTVRASAAATDYSCYRVILGMAYKANKTTVGVSVRELCEAAGIGSYETAAKALRRLEDKHRLLVRVGNEDGAATYRLKTVSLKGVHSLIQTTPVVTRSECTLLRETLSLRNSSPDMPEFDKNGRKIPKGKQSPVDALVKVCGWILDMVHASPVVVSPSVLSERCGVREDNLKKRYLTPMTIAGLIKATEGGYTTATNVEEALRDELKVSGCDERAELQRERHERERKAYKIQKNEDQKIEPDTQKLGTPKIEAVEPDGFIEDLERVENPKIAPVEEEIVVESLSSLAVVEEPIHDLSCECDDCLFPEPRCARLWRSPRVRDRDGAKELVAV